MIRQVDRLDDVLLSYIPEFRPWSQRLYDFIARRTTSPAKTGQSYLYKLLIPSEQRYFDAPLPRMLILNRRNLREPKELMSVFD